MIRAAQARRCAPIGKPAVTSVRAMFYPFATSRAKLWAGIADPAGDTSAKSTPWVLRLEPRMAPKEAPLQGLPRGVIEPSDFTVYEEIADVLCADEPVSNTIAARFGAKPTPNAPGPAPLFDV